MYDTIINSLPGISNPVKRLTFKQRLTWTGLMLLMFLVLGQISLYGVDQAAIANLGLLQQILASTMGSLITLGIGPIVTASIILQLLVGSGIIPWDLQSSEGKSKFQGTQKLLAILFCIFEAFAYVQFGAIPPASSGTGLFLFLVAQIAFGGFLILLMDEVVSKWGIGSGISLFIAAGVTRTIFVGALSPIIPEGAQMYAGIIPQFISYLGTADIFNAFISLLPLIATILVFAIVVYAQAIKVEIPLAFGSFSGFGRRWPLKFIYTSNIPVILTAALLANIRMFGTILAKPAQDGMSCGLLGCFDPNNSPISGLIYYITPPSNVLSIQIFFLTLGALLFIGILSSMFLFKEKQKNIIFGSLIIGLIAGALLSWNFAGLPDMISVLRVFTYMLLMVTGATIFSVFWMETSGMDAKSVAKQIQGIGMQIPGFRRDPRIVERVLSKYILPLTIMGGIFVGIIAAFADFTGALGSGTGILLTAMIIYNLYEQISQKYMEDMNPMFRKVFNG